MDKQNDIHSETISSAVNLSSIRTLDEIKAAYEQLQREEEDVARPVEVVVKVDLKLSVRPSLDEWRVVFVGRDLPVSMR